MPVVRDAGLTFRIDANFRSQMLLVAQGFTPELRELADTVGMDPAAWVLNARVALSDLSLRDGFKAQIALWGRNLTNDRSPAFGTALPFAWETSYQQARTFGVDVNFKY